MKKLEEPTAEMTLLKDKISQLGVREVARLLNKPGAAISTIAAGNYGASTLEVMYLVAKVFGERGETLIRRGDKFSNGKWNKNVKTVGEVVAELSLLDPNLPVHSNFEESVDLVVFNRDQPDKHLEFCDGGEWDNEYEASKGN